MCYSFNFLSNEKSNTAIKILQDYLDNSSCIIICLSDNYYCKNSIFLLAHNLKNNLDVNSIVFGDRSYPITRENLPHLLKVIDCYFPEYKKVIIHQNFCVNNYFGNISISNNGIYLYETKQFSVPLGDISICMFVKPQVSFNHFLGPRCIFKRINQIGYITESILSGAVKNN